MFIPQAASETIKPGCCSLHSQAVSGTLGRIAQMQTCGQNHKSRCVKPHSAHSEPFNARHCTGWASSRQSIKWKCIRCFNRMNYGITLNTTISARWDIWPSAHQIVLRGMPSKSTATIWQIQRARHRKRTGRIPRICLA